MKQKRVEMYMAMAEIVAMQSYAIRKKVGCVIVKDDNVISIGFNGTVSGADNACEDILPDGTLVTKSSVVHSECNALMSAAKNGKATNDAIMFVTFSPCIGCASLIKQAGISKVYYSEKYRDMSGVDALVSLGVHVEQYEKL